MLHYINPALKNTNHFIIAALRRLVPRHAFVPLTCENASVNHFIILAVVLLSIHIASFRRLILRHASFRLYWDRAVDTLDTIYITFHSQLNYTIISVHSVQQQGFPFYPPKWNEGGPIRPSIYFTRFLYSKANKGKTNINIDCCLKSVRFIISNQEIETLMLSKTTCTYCSKKGNAYCQHRLILLIFLILYFLSCSHSCQQLSKSVYFGNAKKLEVHCYE